MNDMNDTLENACISAVLVAERERMSFLPKHFGELVLLGEATVYGWMARLCPSYSGGYWNFYSLSNGGFYMAPVGDDKLMQLDVDGNGFDGEVSADAAGVIATLFALSHLSHQLVGTADGDNVAENFIRLRDFAAGHVERGPIFQAID